MEVFLEWREKGTSDLRVDYDDNRFDVRMRQMVKNYQDHAPQNDVSINDNNNKIGWFL